MATSEPVSSQQDIEAERQLVLLQDLVDGVVFDLSSYTSYRHKVTFGEDLKFQRKQEIKLLFMGRVGLI
jgi:hypothetical protein